MSIQLKNNVLGLGKSPRGAYGPHLENQCEWVNQWTWPAINARKYWPEGKWYHWILRGKCRALCAQVWSLGLIQSRMGKHRSVWCKGVTWFESRQDQGKVMSSQIHCRIRTMFPASCDIWGEEDFEVSRISAGTEVGRRGSGRTSGRREEQGILG